MGTIIKKRKLIDVSEDTAQTLGILAVRSKMSLKAYMEYILDKAAREAKEDETLLHLSRKPSANKPASKKETEEILNLLGL